MNVIDMVFVDFRKSEHTNFQELARKNASYRTLGKNDAVGLVNTGKTQIIWIKGFYIININGSPQVKFIRSERIRMLDGEKWDSLRVVAYARQAGFTITNFHFIDKALRPLRKQVEKLKRDWGVQKKAA